MWDFTEEERERYLASYTKVTYQQFQDKYDLSFGGVILGNGTFGTVFKIISNQGQELAIKKFNRNATRNFKQILREVDSLKELQHPNIARFYDCYVIDNMEYCMVMEYCPGGTVTDYLKKNPLSDTARITLCSQIAEALAYAHTKHMAHRDLKPENVLVGSNGEAKICDFGCCIKTQTTQGIMASRIGSLPYMDQRVYDGEQYDLTADLFGLGMVFLAVFHGKGIYDDCLDETSLTRMRSQLNKNYDQNIRQYLVGLPGILKPIVYSCLHPDPLQRVSASQIVKNLRQPKSISLLSTHDEEDLQDHSSMLAIQLLACSHTLAKQHTAIASRRYLLDLLTSQRTRLKNILNNLISLKHIDKHSKDQVAAFVLFYYLFWLNGLELLLKGKQSPLTHRYPSLPRPDSPLPMQHIEQQIQYYRPLFLKICRRASQRLRLLDSKVYMPSCLAKAINNAAQGLQIDCQQEEPLLKKQILMLYHQRIRIEFQQEAGKKPQPDALDQLKQLQALLEKL